MLRFKWWSASLVAALAMSICGSAAAQTETEILGPWHGTLRPGGGVSATVLLTIRQGVGGGLAAIFSQPFEGPGNEIAVSSIAVKDGVLDFGIARANVSFQGKWNAAAHRWDGVFKRSAFDIPLTLEAGRPPARPVVAGMDGVWQGSIERNGAKLRLVLRVATTDYGTVVVLDAPDQLSFGQEVPVFSRSGDNIRLEIPGTRASFEATLSGDSSQMTGVWKRPGMPDADVTFTHASAPVARFSSDRPQTPKPPFDYRVENVTFDNPSESGVRLAGTLTLPKGAGPFPAAILIQGSGGGDRDDTFFGHKPFAVIADHLTKHGIAVLRYDSRGHGASTGDYAAATDVDLATDANAAARYLMSRPEIRRDAIGFIAHSEGGVIAPIAMASNGQIAFLVMLAGPGVRWDKLLLYQQRVLAHGRGEPERQADRDQRKIAAIYRVVEKADSDEAGIKAVLPLLTPEAMTALGAGQDKDQAARGLNSPWSRYLLRYDPAASLSGIHVPVLALGGTLDQQIPSDENLPAIKAELTGSPDVTIREIPGLNHMFQPAKTGFIGEYAQIQETFAPVPLDIMTDWIAKRFAGQQAAFASSRNQR